MKIIAGLGNIGEKYLKTRHNCGFLALDQYTKDLEEKHSISVNWKADSKLKAITAKINFKNEELLLVKPTTLMNNSGIAIQKILQFYKETPENLTVIYDDIDLPLGEIRIKDQGGAGTHNGMRSIIGTINSENFKRIRIGIESRGELTPEQQDISSFVLSDFTEEEYPIIKKSLEQAAKEI